MKNLNDTEYLTLKGAGGGGDDGSENTAGGYTNRPDSLRSTDSFEILLGLGSGRWKGLTNGLKSLYINDVPLTNTDGTSNFKEVTTVFADGDPAQQQTVTFKLGGGGGVTGINTQLSNTNTTAGVPGPWISGATTTTNADFIDFRFVVQQLYHSTKTGISEATATVEIQMRPQGAATWYNPLITPGVPTTYNPGDASTPVTPVPVTPTLPPPPPSGTPTTPTPVPYYPNNGSGTGTFLTYQRSGGVETNIAARRPDFDSDLPNMKGSGGGDDPDVDPDQSYTAPVPSIDYTGGSDTFTTLPASTPGYIVINGKTMSTFVKELRVSVPKTGAYTAKTWEVRARLKEQAHQYVNPDTENQEEYVRTVVFESVTSVIKQVLGFDEHWKGLVWMQVVGNASDQLSGFPSIRGIYDTKIVKVPGAAAYNPVTRQYTGTVWDGAFVSAYTNDPAWCIKDLIEDTISGIAAISPGATLDKWDALDASKYCSQLVSNGSGGTHPRYSMNFRLDNEVNAQELIQYMAGAFNGLCVDTGGGKWRLRIDKPETPVTTYTLDNIVGDFQYSHTDIDSRFNDITLTFLNEDLNYQEDRLRVYDSDHITRYGRKPTTIVAVGATNRQEVLRRGVIRLRTSLNETRIVKFQTNRQGKLLEPLHTIFIADQGLGYTPPTGSGALADVDPYDNRTTSRISSMNVARDQITLGRTVRLEPTVTYKVKITVPNSTYNPDITTQPSSADWRSPTIVIERTLTNTTGQRGDVSLLFLDSALPANTPANAVVALSATGMPTLPVQYRIIDLQPSDGEMVSVTAMIIDTAKYTASDNGTGTDIDAWIQTGRTSGGPSGGTDGTDDNYFIRRPTVPSWGMFQFSSFMNAGQQQRILTVNWVKPTGNTMINRYQVSHKVGDAHWQIHGQPSSQVSFEYTDLPPGRHDFKVEAIDMGGVHSRPLYGSYLIPALAAGVGIPHSYGNFVDRPTTQLVVGQLYTAEDKSPVITYKWNGTAWTIQSSAGADLHGGSILDGGLARWGGLGSVGLVDSGAVDPTRRLARDETRTILGTSAAITGQGALATKSTVAGPDISAVFGVRNLAKDGSFESDDVLSTLIHTADGGGWQPSTGLIMTTGAFHGSRYLRVDAIGGHRVYFPTTFTATSTSVSATAVIKDSGIAGWWYGQGAGQPDRPHSLIFVASVNTTLNPYIAQTEAAFQLAAGAGWTKVTGHINGLTIGQTYNIGTMVDGYSGRRMLDIDAVMAVNGDVATDYLGVLADQATVDWDTGQVRGAKRPSDNAGTVGLLKPLGNYSVVLGNTVQKTAGSHGAFEGGAIGTPIKGPSFIQSGLLAGMAGGGWQTAIALDTNPASLDLAGASFVLLYVSSGSGTGSLYLYSGGNLVGGTGFFVSTTTANSRIRLTYDENQVVGYIDGVLKISTPATPGLVLYPKVLDYYRSILATPPDNMVRDVLYGPYWLRPDANANIVDSASVTPSTSLPRASLITLLGTAAGITSQGALATQSSVNWDTGQVTGVKRPSDKAGTSGVLSTLGSNTTVVGNTVLKTTGTHGAYEGAAVGSPITGSCFIQCSLYFGAGWNTSLGLDTSATQYASGPQSTTPNNYGATFIGDGSGGGSLSLYVNGSLVGGSVATVPPVTANARMRLSYNENLVKVTIDGVVYKSVAATATGQTLYPKVYPYHRSDSSTELGTYDVLYGIYRLTPDANSNIVDSGSVTPTTAIARASIITLLGTAASITSQGALATKNAATWATDVTGAGKPADNATIGGTFGTDLKETVGGATATLANFKTSSGTAAGIASQADWATYTGVNTTTMANRTQNLTTVGRLSDYTGYEANRSYGLRSVFTPPTLSDTWTSGTVVTINIGASTLTNDLGTAINLPSGSLASRNFATTYYIYRTMTNPASSTGSYGSTTSLAGAIDPQRLYLGYFTTRPSSGGSSPGGGGYGGNNCVVEEAFVGDKLAKYIIAGDIISVLDESTMSSTKFAKVKSASSADAQCVRITTLSGYQLTEALNTPITQPNGQPVIAAHSLNGMIPVKNKDGFTWEPIVSVEPIGLRTVRNIDLGGLTFGAGDTQEAMLYTHNQELKP